MRALISLPDSAHYGKPAFQIGLQKHGYTIVKKVADPKPDDVLVIWNRQGSGAVLANAFERHRARVIVVENGYFGKQWNGAKWYALALGHHNGRGTWRHGGPERWDKWGVELEPWRTTGEEIVLLPQRGIGEPGVAMPNSWTANMLRLTSQHAAPLRPRVRPHPGAAGGLPANTADLRADLANAAAVCTWASGAALQALRMGIPCYYSLRGWIGAEASTYADNMCVGPARHSENRLNMFRRLAWAMWTYDEVASGRPFEYVL